MLAFVIGLFVGATVGAIATGIVAAKKINKLEVRIWRLSKFNVQNI